MIGTTHTGFCIALEAQHNLWRAIPSRCDVFCHVACVLFGIDGEASCQTKVGNLQLAVGIDEQVTRLQITMKDVGRVDVLETAKYLVNEGLEVGVG